MNFHNRWRNRLKAIVLAFSLAVSYHYGLQWWNIFAHNELPCAGCKADFLSLYTGARLFWQDPSSLYDLAKQQSFQLREQPGQGNWVLPFLYPPFAVVPLLPLAWFSYQQAYLLMSIANLLLLGWSLRSLTTQLSMSSDQTSWLLLFTLANTGVAVAVTQGQTSQILLFILTSFFMAWRRGQDYRAGVWSSVLCFKPQIGALNFMLVHLPPKRQQFRAFAISSIVLAVFSFALVGSTGMRRFVDLMLQALGGNDRLGVHADKMHNLRALSIYFLPYPWANYLWLALSIGVCGLTIRICRQFDNSQENVTTKGFWIMVALLLVSPHLHTHDLTLLILPLAFYLHRCQTTLSAANMIFVVAAAVLPFVAIVIGPAAPPIVPVALLAVFLARTQSTFKTLAPSSTH
jgi:hypothetical protein